MLKCLTVLPSCINLSYLLTVSIPNNLTTCMFWIDTGNKYNKINSSVLSFCASNIMWFDAILFFLKNDEIFKPFYPKFFWIKESVKYRIAQKNDKLHNLHFKKWSFELKRILFVFLTVSFNLSLQCGPRGQTIKCLFLSCLVYTYCTLLLKLHKFTGYCFVTLLIFWFVFCVGKAH